MTQLSSVHSVDGLVSGTEGDLMLVKEHAAGDGLLAVSSYFIIVIAYFFNGRYSKKFHCVRW